MTSELVEQPLRIFRAAPASVVGEREPMARRGYAAFGEMPNKLGASKFRKFYRFL
jgi:hypothetical protein